MSLPLVGRTAELAAIRAHLDAPGGGGVLVAGDAGVGTSRLLDEVCRDRPAARAWAMGVTAKIPLATLASLLPDHEGTVPQLLAALESSLDPEALLVVDDLSACDALSLAVLRRAIRRGRSVLASVRTTSGALPSNVAELVLDGAALVEVGPFDRATSDLALAHALGAPADDGLSAHLWRAARGNALFLVQMVDQARRDGALRRDEDGWVLTRPLRAPAGLRALFLGRLAELEPEERELAELLAGTGTLALAVVEANGHAGALAGLETRGLVAYPDDDAPQHVQLAHPLFGEAIWSVTAPARRRELVRRYLRTPGAAIDPVRRAVLALEAGEHVDASTLLLAARRSSAGGSVTQTLELALGAIEAGAESTDAALLAADALVETGQSERAVDLLTTTLERTPPGPDAVALTVAAYEAALWQSRDLARADAVLRTEARRYGADDGLGVEAFTAARAYGLAYADRPVEAAALLDTIDRERSRPPLVEALLGATRTHIASRRGLTSEALVVSTDTHERLGPLLEGTQPNAHVTHLAIRSLALREHGLLAEATRTAELAHALALESGFVHGRAWSAASAALAWLHVGDCAAAESWARRALVTAQSVGLVDAEQISLETLILAAAYRGRTPEPRWAQRATAMPEGERFLAHQSPIAAAWVERAAGRSSRAIDVLRVGQERAHEAGVVASEAWILHERVRLGDVEGTAAALADLPQWSPLTRARLELAAGLEGRDVERLAVATDAFESLGAWLFAAEASAAASRELSGRQSAAAAHRAETLATRAGSPRTPMLRGAEAAPLTARELEVANQAARGATSSAIARELGISVRTVENHLAHAYTKVGVTSRTELASRLGLPA